MQTLWHVHTQMAGFTMTFLKEYRMWFETLTGFHEQSPEQVRNNISVDAEVMKSYVNGKEFVYGILEIPTLAELRNRVHSSEIHAEELSVREVIANVQHLHASESNALTKAAA